MAIEIKLKFQYPGMSARLCEILVRILYCSRDKAGFGLLLKSANVTEIDVCGKWVWLETVTRVCLLFVSNDLGELFIAK